MNFQITNINHKVSDQYPYTHRVEYMSTDSQQQDQIQQWLDHNKIHCCVVPYQSVSPWGQTIAIYLQPAGLTAFLLKWA